MEISIDKIATCQRVIIRRKMYNQKIPIADKLNKWQLFEIRLSTRNSSLYQIQTRNKYYAESTETYFHGFFNKRIFFFSF